MQSEQVRSAKRGSHRQGELPGAPFLNLPLAPFSGTGQLVNAALLVINWNSSGEALRLINQLNSAVGDGLACAGILVLDNHSSREEFQRLIEGVREIGTGDLSHVLGFGGEGVEECQRIGGMGCDLVICRTSRNAGFAGGCNRGIDLIECLWSAGCVVIVNPDVHADVAALEALVATFQVASVAIVGGRIQSGMVKQEDFVGSTFWGELLWSRAGRWHVRCRARTRGVVEVDMVAGSVMALSGDFIQAIKAGRGFVFDERLFLYGEELEMCQWAKREGHRVATAGGARFVHEMKLLSAGPGEVLNAYYCSRNLLWVGRSYLGASARLLFEGLFPLARLTHAVRNALRCRFQVAAAMVAGLRDGYLGRSGEWTWHSALEAKRGPTRERP